jgi:hypothetical protein
LIPGEKPPVIAYFAGYSGKTIIEGEYTPAVIENISIFSGKNNDVKRSIIIDYVVENGAVFKMTDKSWYKFCTFVKFPPPNDISPDKDFQLFIFKGCTLE